jgi:hypothetical protein
MIRLTGGEIGLTRRPPLLQVEAGRRSLASVMKKNNITYTTTDSLGNNTKYGVNRFGRWLEIVSTPNRLSALYSNSPANRARILREIKVRGIKIPSSREHFFAEPEAFAH